jgi:hypothetical protein
MTRTRLISLTLFVLGLTGVAIAVGISQARGGSISGDSPVVVLVIPLFLAGVLLVLVPGCVFLSDLFPSGERTQVEGELFWLGVLSHFPLAVGIFNSVVEQNRISGFDIPRMVLNGAAVTVAFWFIYYCIRDVMARNASALATVIWAIVLLLGNLVAVPVYWWLYLRRRPAWQATGRSNLTDAR